MVGLVARKGLVGEKYEYMQYCFAYNQYSQPWFVFMNHSVRAHAHGVMTSLCD